MKYNLKIIKESQKRSSSLENFYSLLGIHPGSLDVFWSHFIDTSFEVETQRREFITSMFGDQNKQMTLGDAPPNGPGREKALKELRGLNGGLTFYWDKYYGPEEVDMIIEFKVLSYANDLKDRLDAINYTTIQPEEYMKLTDEQKAPVLEKHFMEDYGSQFLEEELGSSAMNTTGFLGNPGVGSGMAGMARDWWMTTSPEGFPIFKKKMLEAIATMPKR